MRQLIRYIVNPVKTDNGSLAGYKNVSMLHPDRDMIRTMEHFGKVSDHPGCRLAYHYVISFKKNDGTTPEQAYSIVDEFCRKHLSGYELVFGVHTDKEHMHCHVAFNATSYVTGKKYRYEDGQWAREIQPDLDKICKKYGCHNLSEDTGISMEEYEKDRKRRKRKPANTYQPGNHHYYNEKMTKFSRSAIIRNDIDEAILLSSSFEQFLAVMRERGYSIKYGEHVKHMTVRQHDGGQNRRVDTLDRSGYYSEAMIKKRIADKNKPVPHMPVNEEYRFIVPPAYRIVRLPRRPLNAYEKQYYAKMYRLGMQKKRHWVSYSEIKKSMKEIALLNERLKIMHETQADQKELEKLQSQQKEQCVIFQKEIEDCKEKQKTYHLIFRAAASMKKLEIYHTAFENGDVSCKTENLEYLKWEEYLKEYGYTMPEALKARDQLKEHYRNAKRQLFKANRKLQLVNEVAAEFSSADIKSFTIKEQNLEQVYAELQEQDQREQESNVNNKQKSRKER